MFLRYFSSPNVVLFLCDDSKGAVDFTRSSVLASLGGMKIFVLALWSWLSSSIAHVGNPPSSLILVVAVPNDSIPIIASMIVEGLQQERLGSIYDSISGKRYP